jgi:hypothetical protein
MKHRYTIYVRHAGRLLIGHYWFDPTHRMITLESGGHSRTTQIGANPENTAVIMLNNLAHGG